MSDSVVPSGDDAALHAHVASSLSATYEIEQEIGRGGMGIVYRARDRRLKRPVAIKVLPPELAFRRDVRTRFLREAETAAQLSHPHIVPIYSVDEVDTLVFFVMACVDGDNLARQLATRGPLPVGQARRWLTEVAEALAYAHARGVIHRDIKPDNILVDAIDGRALVTDFGIARAATDTGETARLTATGVAIGTPAYMSPEQASGDRDLDARSDLYSLGIVAYHMLVGAPPFVGNATPALLVKHLSEMPVPVTARRPDVPADLAALVMRLLEKAPEHRPQSAQDLVYALKGLPASDPSSRPSPLPLGGMPLPGASGVEAASPAPYAAPAYTARTGVTPAVESDRGSATPAGTYPEGAPVADLYPPTADERARWSAPQVIRFRRKLAPYLFVNGAIILVSVLSPKNYLGITALWTIILAWQYGKLWTQGYDWHDVLRQPTHRLLGEVLSDLADTTIATFSRRRRDAMRAAGRLPENPLARALAVHTPAEGTPRRTPAAPSTPPATSDLGAYSDAVRVARSLHADIDRAVATATAMGRSERRDLLREARQHLETIETHAAELARGAAEQAGDRAQAIAREIAMLEAEANPADASRSEARVRRLAQLRRDRRSIEDLAQRREVALAAMEDARVHLETLMRTLRQRGA